jgi:hypothetical protein
LSAAAAWQTVGGVIGILGVIGVLARISYQLGSLVTEFRAYVRLNDIIVGEIKERVRLLEARRRALPAAGGEEPGVGARREVPHGALGLVDLVEVLVLRGAEAHLAAVGAFQPAGPRGVASDAAGAVAFDAVDEG